MTANTDNNYDIVDGNTAAAIAVKLCRPDVIAAYPITPQTPLVEKLSEFVASGELDAVICEVESEHSALSVLHGASLAGARTFTATSSQGLALMFEPYFRTATLRLPIVMAIVNRELASPQSIWCSHQDSISVRDAGWIQIYVENNQEILDSIIQAYRIAEDKRVFLPVNVCYDGFYLSHMTEKVLIPDQREVDRFLPPYKPDHVLLDPELPVAIDPLTPSDLLTEYRQRHVKAMMRAKNVIKEVDDVFKKHFGRSYGGLIEEYRCEDADYLVITLGSMSGAAKDAVDSLREKGYSVGLLRIRALRPFPSREIAEILESVKAFGVVDRNVSFGWGCGTVYQEVLSALNMYGICVPSISFIGGLGGADLDVPIFEYVIKKIISINKYKYNKKVFWLKVTEEGL